MPRPDALAALTASPALLQSGARDLAHRVRGMIRGSEIWLVVIAGFVGIASGLSVALIGTISDWAHRIIFNLRGERLSAAPVIHQGLAAPIVGGLILGAVTLLWIRRRSTQPLDPIEANALHGGRLSMRDSLWVTFQTLLSNGCGASVGLEAAYAQMGGGIASKLGVALRLRRNDLRVLVGCGTAGAIGAAFGAPLTGAFYAFELIVGSYSVANVAPILTASVVGVLTARALRSISYNVSLPTAAPMAVSDYLVMISLGIICAALGVLIMRLVSWVEKGFELARLPRAFRPAVGGCVVVGLAIITPQVLAAGHGALRLDLPAKLSIGALVVLIGLKIVASTVSLGSGFRGGLFFASLFLGALMGKLFAAVMAVAVPSLAVEPTVCILVGMATLAVAVVGGPLTMSFLVLETTGDFAVTALVLAASVITSLVVRETFGYSFSTWRMHLRGETIRGAIDVGWMRSLTVGRMMRRDPETILGEAGLGEMRRRFPLGSTQRVVVTDTDGKYLGVALTAEAFASADNPDEDAKLTVADIAHWADTPLTPEMNVKDAVALFDRIESEALAVVDTRENRKVLGLMTEGYALRRYAEELDKARQGLAGGV
jgi:CIC family chloride channel protein